MKGIEKKIADMRKDILRMTYNAGSIGAHVGGSLSMVEIMAALYFGCMKIDVKDVTSEARDRLILSKGHGVMAQYAALKQVGLLTDAELDTFKKDGTRLYAHPSADPSLGIEFSSGSLGQGLSQAVGVALALKRKHNTGSRVYVVLGDGECDEGSVWEAAMAAAHYGLDNIVAIVDNNMLQYDGATKSIMGIDPMDKKWQAFGWCASVVDGHSYKELVNAVSQKKDKPHVVIANTVKGKGVSFMENEPKWHNGRLTSEQYEQAVKEIEGQC